ncbi:TetR/AcrR family transcriptional regulator [uncultured Aliiroseovarius sp.]|uniref:TetR/AcrR family transcriptional regulator n=1 Tax=uncultured Aliiroseovarius sp. TaxID=1658783 RepID=UPI002592192B|nr:TetR/AcrR family transcriptional regulator [uncultured Aliiroseovarius sp.]
MTPNQSKRARSKDQKVERHEAILAAARDLIRDLGFDGVKMSALANRAGLAKGTLYLYVRSKEELFLLLFVDALDDVVSRFENDNALGNDPAQLADRLTELAEESALFLPLYARLVAVIEANVADEPLFDAKRNMAAILERFTVHLAKLMDLDFARAQLVSRVLMNVMQGTAQFDLTAGRDPAGLPDDLKDAFAIHAFAPNFRPAAELILRAAPAQND